MSHVEAENAMSTIDKFVQMLESSKASARYDACEELRVANESSPAAVAALEKATQDPNRDVAEAAKNALEAEVHARMLGRPTPRTKEQALRDELARRVASILIVTTPSIEGRSVEEYLGLVSSEVVLGTGFLSELGAGLADVFGVRADAFQNKLKEAKAAALNELRARAFEMSADAIIGVDLDYSTLSSNMLMLVANGTAVRLKQARSEGISDN